MPEKKQPPKKTAKVEDLSAKKAKDVKGGLNFSKIEYRKKDT